MKSAKITCTSRLLIILLTNINSVVNAAYSSFVQSSSSTKSKSLPSSCTGGGGVSYFAYSACNQMNEHNDGRQSSSYSNGNGGDLMMRVKRKTSRTRDIAGSAVTQANYNRVKSAGRKGTKRFVDPNKLFVGNLSYSVTSEQLKEWFIDQALGDQLISCKVITDWKTNKSKGYGFAQFTSPLYATAAMENIRGKKLQGRVVRLDQGKKKEPEQLYFVKKTNQMKVEDEEDAIIAAATDAQVIAEDENEEEQESDRKNPFVDEDGILSVRALLKSVEYEDFDDDELDGEDDDFEYDGVFEEEYEDVPEFGDDGVFKNRSERRAEARANKRRKKKGRGFGN